MSRIGKQPVKIPGGVDVNVAGRLITVKGPKGQLKYEHPLSISVSVKDGEAIIERDSDRKEISAFHGLVRSIVQNMVTGVSEGFKKVLEIQGTGYRAQVQGKKLVLNVGYSNPVDFETRYTR